MNVGASRGEKSSRDAAGFETAGVEPGFATSRFGDSHGSCASHDSSGRGFHESPA